MDKLRKKAVIVCIKYCILEYADNSKFCQNQRQILEKALRKQLNAWDLAEIGAYSDELQCTPIERYHIYTWLINLIQIAHRHVWHNK